MGPQRSLVVLLLALGSPTGAALAQNQVSLVSVSSTGELGDDDSTNPAVDRTGTRIAFESRAANLVGDDTNLVTDVFLRDRAAGTTTRVSVGPGGAQAELPSYRPDVSADGLFVAFDSAATALSPLANGVAQVWVRDLVAGTTELVSVGLGGAAGDGKSTLPKLSDDGRFVLFQSSATDLVGMPVGTGARIYVRDRALGTTTWLDVPLDGQPPALASWVGDLAGDAGHALFGSYVDDLVPGDGNGFYDVFRVDLQSGQIDLVSVTAGGVPASGLPGGLSEDGRFAAFWSTWQTLDPSWTGSPFGNVYVRDMQTGAVQHVAGAALSNNFPTPDMTLSASGRHVAWEYDKSGALPDAPAFEVFVHDAWTGFGFQVSTLPNFAFLNGSSHDPRISGDGTAYVFSSRASDLVPGDDNLSDDVFVDDRPLPSAVKYCTQAPTAGGCVSGILKTGSVSVSGLPLTVIARDLPEQRVGMLVLSTSSAIAPWQPTFEPRCLAAPLVRTPVQSTGGTGAGCTGTLTLDLTAWMAANPQKAPAVGQTVYVQGWFRDAPAQSSFSRALAFELLP